MKLVSCAGNLVLVVALVRKWRELTGRSAWLLFTTRSGLALPERMRSPASTSRAPPVAGRSRDPQRSRTTTSARRTQVPDPRGTVHRRSDVIALVAQLHLAGVDADSQPDRGQRRAAGLVRTPRHRWHGRKQPQSCPRPAPPGTPRWPTTIPGSSESRVATAAAISAGVFPEGGRSPRRRRAAASRFRSAAARPCPRPHSAADRCTHRCCP